MRPSSTLRLLYVIVIAAAASASPLLALRQARVYGVVQDENGKPVPGVSIVVTHKDISNFRTEATTDDKGEFSVTLVDATRTYIYTVSKDGFQTVVENVKVPIDSNTEHDFSLMSGQTPAAVGGAGGAGNAAIAAYNEAIKAVDAGDLEGARAKLEEAIKLDPELATAYTALAGIETKQKHWKEAAAAAEKAISRDPGDERALRLRYDALVQLGDKAGAAAAAKALAAVDSSAGAEASYTQAAEKFNAGDLAGAKAQLESALAANPDYARAHYLMGLVLAGSDPAGAKQHLQRFIELAPDDPDAATAKEMLAYLK
jgi:Tfp pilus assembly protein PilF